MIATGEIEFPYFADPINYAYLRDDDRPCDLCGTTGHRLGPAGLYGPNRYVESVCFYCMHNGALEPLDIFTNDVATLCVRDAIEDKAQADRLIKEISYRTPSLPTWQDHVWPFVDGDFCKFIKIASKPDFARGENLEAGKTVFFESLLDKYRETDLDHLWSLLPEHPITSQKTGNYDVSIYLFLSRGRPVCIWDAS